MWGMHVCVCACARAYIYVHMNVCVYIVSYGCVYVYFPVSPIQTARTHTGMCAVYNSCLLIVKFGDRNYAAANQTNLQDAICSIRKLFLTCKVG
jgi:hypothetical protein